MQPRKSTTAVRMLNRPATGALELPSMSTSRPMGDNSFAKTINRLAKLEQDEAASSELRVDASKRIER
jgi:hypothetical protein